MDSPKFNFVNVWFHSILSILAIGHMNKKLIGVQSNHGVEYFGGPAAPTHRDTTGILPTKV